MYEGPQFQMLGSERQRAYRYGMTLLCVGVFFNWLSITENNSDPVRFVGFTCLASGALLVCMAICLWANSTRHHNSQVRPERNDTSSSGSESQREPSHATEKPPDYDTVADTTPPPSYADAILLCPAALPISTESPAVTTEVVTVVNIENEATTNADKDEGEESSSGEPSRFSRVLRLSKRFLRRSRSNTEVTDAEAPPVITRSISAQENKPS